MCETCDKAKWYASALSQALRDQAEFGPFETQASKDAKRLAAYHVDRVFEEWPGKYGGYPDKSRR